MKPNPEKDLPALLDDCRRYMAKQARELIVCNVSDTILAGSFLSSASLKVVIKCCVDETRNMIEKHPSNAKILKIGCDGESLHLVTRTNKNEGALVGSQGGEVKKCILCASTYQMVLLLMFNTREKVTYEEMREERLISDM